LRNRETAVTKDNAGELLVCEAHQGTRPRDDVDSASTLPGQRIGQAHSAFTPAEASREQKRQKTDRCGPLSGSDPPSARTHPTRPGPAPLEKRGSNNAKRRMGGVRLREQRLTSAMASGKSVQRPGTKVPTVRQVDPPPAPRSGPHIPRHIRHVSSSDAEQSQVTSTQRIELVVITDTEPESSENDKN
jgi:hypothetical protein